MVFFGAVNLGDGLGWIWKTVLNSRKFIATPAPKSETNGYKVLLNWIKNLN